MACSHLFVGCPPGDDLVTVTVTVVAKAQALLSSPEPEPPVWVGLLVPPLLVGNEPLVPPLLLGNDPPLPPLLLGNDPLPDDPPDGLEFPVLQESSAVCVLEPPIPVLPKPPLPPLPLLPDEECPVGLLMDPVLEKSPPCPEPP